jgi:asparagine synthase (glutamine-hydrolysing)
MCGIAGMISGSRRICPATAAKVLESLRHRGPDDLGWLLYSHDSVRTGRESIPQNIEDCDLMLMHRRLSILDLTRRGWQPMRAGGGRYSVVYNGEIYNYIELRRELESLGQQFHTHTDTEVLLLAYMEWGVDAVRRFVGMFAFAIFDRKRRTLLLARDFFGIKPLYYSASDEQFAFASEIKALLDLNSSRRRANSAALLLYLRHGLSDQGDTTLLSGIHQLPAAHYMEVSLDDPGVAEPVRFWSPQITPSDASFEEAAQRLRELFIESIQLHLRSDVPVGAALSGGIDSSAIVACIRRVAPQLDIHTFSYVADDPRLNEERWIDLVAGAVAPRVHKTHTTSHDLATDLDVLLKAQEEPFGSTTIYAQHRVFRLASEAGIKVMLDGQGADELLGGYRYYIGAQFASLVRQHRFLDALRLLRSARKLPDSGVVQLLLCSADYFLPKEWQKPLRAMIAKEFTPNWVHAAWFRENGGETANVNYCSGPHVLRSALLRTLTETSLPHLLRYEDRNSMAFSIESRVPFLTPQLAEFVLSLPEEYIVALDGTSKAVFRRAMRGIVPQAILDRKDKIGFATPEREWLCNLNGWVQDTLNSETAAAMPFLDLGAMHREWQAILSGRQSFDNRVWRWLNVIRWSQEFAVDYAA